eukprot:s6_g51.t3
MIVDSGMPVLNDMIPRIRDGDQWNAEDELSLKRSPACPVGHMAQCRELEGVYGPGGGVRLRAGEVGDREFCARDRGSLALQRFKVVDSWTLREFVSAMASPQVQSPGQQWQLVQGFSNLSLQTPQLQPQSQVPPQVVQGFSNLGLQSPQQAQWQMLSQMQPQVVSQLPSPGLPGPGPLPAASSVQRLRLSAANAATGTATERLGALIVTVTEGSSYDPIFQQVEQTDDQGTCVATYRVSLTGVQQLLSALEGRSLATTGDLGELVTNLQQLPAEKVVFNWECCSCCSERGFQTFGAPSCGEATLKLAKVALDRGYMVMFSDFSLKALIASWNSDYFGPKPFQQTGGCSGRIRLNFDPEVLKTCSSKQLAKVGELCEEGKAVIHAASNTIVYQLLPSAAQEAERSQAYRLEVLTTVSCPAAAAHAGYGAVYGGINAAGFSQAPSSQKSMGHVLLTYPSGGRMLTSAGHWKELVHLGGVSEDALLRVAERYYGKEFSSNLGMQLQQCPDAGSRMQMQQAYAQQCVQWSPDPESSESCNFVKVQCPVLRGLRKGYEGKNVDASEDSAVDHAGRKSPWALFNDWVLQESRNISKVPNEVFEDLPSPEPKSSKSSFGAYIFGTFLFFFGRTERMIYEIWVRDVETGPCASNVPPICTVLRGTKRTTLGQQETPDCSRNAVISTKIVLRFAKINLPSRRPEWRSGRNWAVTPCARSLRGRRTCPKFRPWRLRSFLTFGALWRRTWSREDPACQR